MSATDTNTIEALSTLVRLAPLQLGDLPSHPDLPLTSAEADRPELLPFVTTLLRDGAAFLDKPNFERRFRRQGSKSAAPSAAHVETLTAEISFAELTRIDWGRKGPDSVRRTRPRYAGSEFWAARKSVHKDAPSGENHGSASWDEFVFGLRDNHSVNEGAFTPNIYDVQCVVSWDDQVQRLVNEQGRLGGSSTGSSGTGGYSNVSCGVFEMCHTLPAPLAPRCFAVLVATASVDEDWFVAVTVPVSLGTSVEGALYSSGRNQSEGEDAQKRKRVVDGVYCAVEACRRNRQTNEVEWTMATSSNAKGNLPMLVQKMGVPGAIVKDVGYFMKWIPTARRE